MDAGRTVRWVRQHDAVIVPGMGVLEASLPLRAWGVPYAMFLLCAGGRLTGTKVALVSVGANNINQRPTRFFFNTAARLAYYRSYRDAQSREAMTTRGVNVSADQVYPDLVFGLPVSPDPGDPATVGVGVMTYRGTNDDRDRADEIYGAYVTTFTRFILWLLDQGRSVRVFVGDKTDDEALAEITGRVRRARPELEPGRLVAEPPATFSELSRSMAPVSCVIATRYHNVMCSLRLGKPTISLGYARKNLGPDGGDGAGRVLPVGQLARPRPADQAVHRARVAGAGAAPGHRLPEPGQRPAARPPVRPAGRAAVPRVPAGAQLASPASS